MNELAFLMSLAIAALGIYLLPALIAWGRGARNVVLIVLVTVLFGWTGVGWFAALLWAAFDPQVEARSPTA